MLKKALVFEGNPSASVAEIFIRVEPNRCEPTVSVLTLSSFQTISNESQLVSLEKYVVITEEQLSANPKHV